MILTKTYKNKQLELFPEQPKEVETLRTEMAVIDNHIQGVARVFEIATEALRKNKRAAAHRLQEICIHPEIRIEHDHDYHNNIDWDLHICTTCDKQLKKV
jgi:hypothetical protein